MHARIEKRCPFLVVLVLLFPVMPVQGQPAAAPTPPTDAVTTADDSDGGPTVGDSRVGYIDNAIPGNVFRFRYDTAYNNRRPNRAEFFWAKGSGGGGPGVPRPETSVDYQDFTAYLEAVAPGRRLSGFVELPSRLVNPEINPNSGGYADMNAGFKYAFVRQDDLVATFQFRTYIPTGDADRGLGNNHVSLEPALLSWARLSDRLCLEGELRYWIPIGGSEFAGDIIRYGAGVQYDLCQTRYLLFSPVLEFVGWTVLDGLETVLHPGGEPIIEDAAGDTILNAKLGLRVRVGGSSDVYFGWGRPLTGDRWYENVYRAEWRVFY
jgi:hypothetical protein